MPRDATELLRLIGQKFPKSTREEILSDAVIIGLASIMSSSKYSVPKPSKRPSRDAGRSFTREP